MGKIFKVRTLVTVTDGSLAHLIDLPWKQNTVRDISETAYNRLCQSYGSGDFEQIGLVIPPSSRKVEEIKEVEQKEESSD